MKAANVPAPRPHRRMFDFNWPWHVSPAMLLGLRRLRGEGLRALGILKPPFLHGAYINTPYHHEEAPRALVVSFSLLYKLPMIPQITSPYS